VYIPVEVLLLLGDCIDDALALTSESVWSSNRCFSLIGAPLEDTAEAVVAPSPGPPPAPPTAGEPVEPVVAVNGDGSSPNELSLAPFCLLNKREMMLVDIAGDQFAVEDEEAGPRGRGGAPKFRLPSSFDWEEMGSGFPSSD
jgi:hypothetical protein